MDQNDLGAFLAPRGPTHKGNLVKWDKKTICPWHTTSEMPHRSLQEETRNATSVNKVDRTLVLSYFQWEATNYVNS